MSVDEVRMKVEMCGSGDVRKCRHAEVHSGAWRCMEVEKGGVGAELVRSYLQRNSGYYSIPLLAPRPRGIVLVRMKMKVVRTRSLE
jgi:hypothetical protein